MNIEQLDNKRVLIDLCTKDMQILSLKPSLHAIYSPVNKNILKSLIRIAQKKIGITIDDTASAYVETMPYDGGCFILITLSNHYIAQRYKVIHKPYKCMFLFDCCEDMLMAVKQLYINKDRGYNATLLLYKHQYYLLVYTKEKISKAVTIILSEYSNSYTNSRDSIKHITTNGKIICNKNTIKKIGSVL